MLYKSKLLGFVTTLITLTGYSQNGEFYFRLIESNKDKVNNIITRTVSIDNVKGDTVYAYANQQEFEALLKLGYKVEMLPHPTTQSAKSIVMATTIPEMANWDRYPTYEVYRAMMKKFETDYPSLCKLDSIGTTVQGRKIYVLKISDNVDTDEPEPEVFYTSTMHGDETTGYILLLRLTDYLLSNYNVLPQAKELIDNLQIYINPNANPDGTYHGGNSTVSSATRYNANSIDINRNFPDPRAGQHPDDKPWQPETQAMMDFASQHRFVLSANFHGGAEVVNYPWDTWTSSQEKHPDNDWYISISRAYADTVHKYSPSTYMDDLNNGITNGGDWYVITGGRQDYMNYFHRCREITIELSNTKLLDSDLLPTYWEYNHAALINFLKNALYGFGGTVKNTLNNPLDAKVIILNHDGISSSAKTNSANGQYFRMVKPGTYDIAAFAGGYKPKIIENVTISAQEFKPLNFTLEPDTTTQIPESFENDVPERFVFSNGTWIKSNQTANTGSYSLKSAPIGNSLSTTNSLTINVRQTGIFSFNHKVSSEANCDFFKLYIDNILQDIWSGEGNWEKFSTILGTGAHNLEWVYVKDGNTVAGSDGVFIDDLVIPKSSGQVSITATVNASTFENLKVELGDSIRITDATGTAIYPSYALDTIVNLKVYSESNPIGDGTVELKWQRVNYLSNFEAHYNATFEVSSEGIPLQSANINFNNELKQTDQYGKAAFSNVPFGLQHPYSVSKDGFVTQSGFLRIASDTLYPINIWLTGVETEQSEWMVKVFPNPISGNFWLDINFEKNSYIDVKLVDLTGKIIARMYSGNAGTGTLKLQGNAKAMNIQPGFYIFVVNGKQYSIRKKVLFTY